MNQSSVSQLGNKDNLIGKSCHYLHSDMMFGSIRISHVLLGWASRYSKQEADSFQMKTNLYFVLLRKVQGDIT